MPNIKKPGFGALKPTGKKPLLYLILIILIVGVVLVFVKHGKNANKPLPLEQISAQSSQNSLSSQDYKSYQITQTVVANEYIGTGQYDNAKRVLNEIIAKVPTDKITSDTYRSFWYLYQQNGDSQNRKKYALLTAEKLKAEGQTKAAAAFEQDAK